MPLQDELYKSLLEESKLYREKVSTIWLQKFTLLGAVIAFAVAQNQIATGKSLELIGAAIIALPVIAVLLDIKLGEFGIHANVIDHFIKRHFREAAVIPEWESTNWGNSSDKSDYVLIRIRSVLTVAVTVIPTCIIVILAGLALKTLPAFSGQQYAMPVAYSFCGIYVTAGFASIPLVLFRR
jgi:hypothetical protein